MLRRLATAPPSFISVSAVQYRVLSRTAWGSNSDSRGVGMTRNNAAGVLERHFELRFSPAAQVVGVRPALGLAALARRALCADPGQRGTWVSGGQIVVVVWSWSSFSSSLPPPVSESDVDGLWGYHTLLFSAQQHTRGQGPRGGPRATKGHGSKPAATLRGWTNTQARHGHTMIWRPSCSRSPSPPAARGTGRASARRFSGHGSGRVLAATG
ncbi:hypothetical protein GGR56DRAFT_153178 [Xylariaceae sp. FL0804]|nr:hypothetical protein GGR56DRAFT_153178 [Xylariaceae sp. FL0804]